MRKPILLSESDKMTAASMRPALISRIGMEATVSFVKADGTPRTLVGTVVEVAGEGDKEVVRMETAEGFRSANVYRITNVTHVKH